MRFGLVKLRDDDCRDCVEVVSSLFTVSCLRCSLKEEICLFPFTFVTVQIVFAWDLHEIWHVEKLGFFTAFLQCMTDTEQLNSL